MIKIVFGKSKSQNYNLAIRKSKNSSSKFEIKEFDNKSLNIVLFDIKKSKEASKLWELIRGWKSSELFINDVPANKYDLEKIITINECSKRKLLSKNPGTYCDESEDEMYFSCRKLRSILLKVNMNNMFIYEYSNLWYKYGNFNEDKKIYNIDKKRIKKLLMEEIEDRYVSECPYFNFKEFNKLIDKLPDEINIEENQDYKIDKDNFNNLVLRTKEEYSILNPQKNDEIIRTQKTKTTYKDLGGLEKEIKLIKESVEIPFKYPELFEHLGIEPYKGILLYGPPGTGKTKLAKAVANEINMNFYSINGPEIFNKYFGESEKQLRKIFSTARANAPSVIFFDEFDSIAGKRRDDSESSFYNKIVTQLLSLLDGMEEREEVIVIAATNKPDSIDPALRRPGRLDFEINISPPDELGREEILKIHTKEMPLDNNVDLEELSKTLYGYVGADIEAICKEAALYSVRRNSEKIKENVLDFKNLKVTIEDFKKAKNKIKPSAGREVLSYKSNVKWNDIIGLEEVKNELMKKIIYPWKNKNKYNFLRNMKGVLLHGPSGVGKTYLAKGLASTLDLNIISIKGSDILSKYSGDSSLKLSSFFKKAKELAPSIIIIDEIDAIANSRKTHTADNSLINELLSQMDGYDDLTDVLVIGTTNFVETIDSAILRPGRFDIKIKIDYPSDKDIKEIFKYHLDKSHFPYDNELIERSFNFKTGAEVESGVLQAIYEAIWNQDSTLKAKHF